MRIPYVYRWTHVPTERWYVGCRTGKNCNPAKHESYICSSKFVKPLILADRQNWKYEILWSGESIQTAIDLETKILKEQDAKNNPMSFNLHNGDGKFSMAGKKNPLVSQALKGRLRPDLARPGDKNFHYNKKGPLSPHYGKKRPDHSLKMKGSGNPMFGKKRPELSNKMKGIPRPQIKLECPHCKKAGGQSNMKRYHFSNCKISWA